jgi:membrane associated rhomboid family serine protease
METNTKLKLIYFPYLLISILFIVAYLSSLWLLNIKLDVLPLKEDVLHYWLPVGLSCIVAYLLLRPRVKLLKIDFESRQSVPIYLLLVATMAVPTVLGCGYLTKVSGDILHLDNIMQITDHKPEKYYTIKDYYLDKNDIGYEPAISYSDKGRSLIMKLYIVVPIRENAHDSVFAPIRAWYGMKYTYSVSASKLDDADKEAEFRDFLNDSERKFVYEDLTKFQYLERAANNEDKDRYLAAIKNNSELNKCETILLPINEPFEERTGSSVMWILVSFAICAVIILIIVLFNMLDAFKLQQLREKKGKIESENEFSELFLPHKRFVVTPVLIFLNIGVFIAMVVAGLGVVSFSGKDLLAWGANYAPMVSAGQYWRLLTSTFLHGGLMHLAFNMYALLLAGLLLEEKIGWLRITILYLLSGIIASMASVAYSDSVSVGASGAIFGLYGGVLAFILTRVFPKQFTGAFIISIAIFVGFNLIMGFADAQIDNAAHIGGLVSGFVIGLLMSFTLPKAKEDDAF